MVTITAPFIFLQTIAAPCSSYRENDITKGRMHLSRLLEPSEDVIWFYGPELDTWRII